MNKWLDVDVRLMYLSGDFSGGLDVLMETPLLHVDEGLCVDAGKGRQVVDKINFIDRPVELGKQRTY